MIDQVYDYGPENPIRRVCNSHVSLKGNPAAVMYYFAVTMNNYNMIAWCSVWGHAVNVQQDQGLGHPFENQTMACEKYMEEWLWARERAFVSKAKALDVMWKPFCVMCSHGIHITYICRMKKYITVCPEGPQNNL